MIKCVLVRSRHFRVFFNDYGNVNGASNWPTRRSAKIWTLHEARIRLSVDKVRSGPWRRLLCTIVVSIEQISRALRGKPRTLRIKRRILVVSLIGSDFGLEHSIRYCTLHVIRVCDWTRLVFNIELLEHFLRL